MPNNDQALGDGANLSEVAILADMVEYQEGSVVSRTVLAKDTGTLTLFAFGVD